MTDVALLLQPLQAVIIGVQLVIEEVGPQSLERVRHHRQQLEERVRVPPTPPGLGLEPVGSCRMPRLFSHGPNSGPDERTFTGPGRRVQHIGNVFKSNKQCKI